MIVREFYKVREDGVALYRTIDAIVDKYGNPVRDEKGNLIPTGKMIIQMPTNIPYNEATDVENAPYTYIESDKDIEKEVQDNGI